jgi:hypothetical protein
MKKTLLFSLIVFTQFSILSQSSFNGYALYNGKNPNQNTAYLIDKDGTIAKTWNCSVACNYTVLLKENGNIVRGGRYSDNELSGAAIGGMVQEIDPSGNIVWEYIYSDTLYCSHHDITLVGDNVMLIAWEVKTANELTQKGYDGTVSSIGKWPTHFVEIAQNGTGGQIVWEWHIWDHLIQDYDQSKNNYGVIANHPELIDINMISGGGQGNPNSGDWFHVNGIDYNEDLDQISFSSRHASEVYIIDHSTTTAEAATHSGGNSGFGGDILYRWGNPSNYGMNGSQVIPAAVHDIRWIENDSRPYGGYLQIFNNSGISNNQSTVDAFLAPLDLTTGYTYLRNPGQAYGPFSYDTRYTCQYSSPGQSASNRMSNGNIFVNASSGGGPNGSGDGIMYEVDANDSIIWQHIGLNGAPGKAFRYECEYPGIISLLNNPCGVDLNPIENKEISIFPNPSNGIFAVNGLTENTDIKILNIFGQIIPVELRDSKIDLSNQPNGIYILNIKNSNGTISNKKMILNKNEF